MQTSRGEQTKTKQKEKINHKRTAKNIKTVKRQMHANEIQKRRRKKSTARLPICKQPKIPLVTSLAPKHLQPWAQQSPPPRSASWLRPARWHSPSPSCTGITTRGQTHCDNNTQVSISFELANLLSSQETTEKRKERKTYTASPETKPAHKPLSFQPNANAVERDTGRATK